MRQSSIVIRISIALAGIVALSMATMMTSYWISDKADSDAAAVNIAGSLRAQSYHFGMLISQSDTDEQQLAAVADKLTQTWQHPIFNSLRHDNPQLRETYRAARNYWQTVQPQLQAGAALQDIQPVLAEQVDLLNQLVASIQQHAERNARNLRMVQVTALFLILLLSAVVIYWLKAKVEQPLSELTQAAKRVGQGDFSYRIAPQELDELGILAQTHNRMSEAIAHMHERMEEQIDQQTRALQRSNTTLQFLYDTAKNIIEHEPLGIDYDRIVTRLAQLIEADDIELCLMTEIGNSPYLQIKPVDDTTTPCAAKNCFSCLKGEIIRDDSNGMEACAIDTIGACRYSFPMFYEQQHYGVLVCRMNNGKTLEHWKQQLIQSVADQLAVALSLQSQEDNARRLALVHERTVIARELHDSLAQALSYLKIQVTRLNRALEKNDKPTLEDVSAELQEGLSSAYRQLRELLTTFRLKVDGPGLLSSLQTSVKQLSEQCDMEITLDYQLNNLPLTPNEEIHLLQIIREAAQNAIHHSEGNKVLISVIQDDLKNVRLSIEDDGVGISQSPEKLNHYGLAIMQERGKNLGGELTIRRRDNGGTGVYFRFTPDYLQQRNLIARQL
ncbi:MAG TPA: histidine kinase [Cellvibrio sp.]|nr:histidine kinase [Cellvibrio sp.]